MPVLTPVIQPLSPERCRFQASQPDKENGFEFMDRMSISATAWLKLFLFLFGLFFATGKLAPSPVSAAEQLRESVLSGTWYPAHPNLLKEQLGTFLNRVKTAEQQGRLIGLIVPHAGYRYSGPIAAHAYKLLERHHFKTVVIIAPSHYVRFKGASVYDRGGYRTPLGIVPLDYELIAAIKRKNPDIRYVSAAHSKEHSLEIQLPFLQLVAPDIKLVPIVMGEQGLAACQKIARTLAECVRDRSVLLVASTDLSHFHSYERATQLDGIVIRHVRQMDSEGLSRDLARGACEACGGGPMIAVMLAAGILGADHSEILYAANSGDVTGDRSRVVGYMAAALWSLSQKGDSADRRPKKITAERLTEKERAVLHQIVRQSIEAHFSGREIALPTNLSLPLKEKRGAFVTLRKKKKLRGCIGQIVGHYPLCETVSQMAVAAAFQDPRFLPVQKDELPELEYEISVMSPLMRVRDWRAVEVGTHGLYIRQGVRSGLLLPQMAVEYGWDRVTFLEQVCRKARLPEQAWKDPDTQIFIFSAEVF